ncbi:transglutaminase domain-containing protein [Cryobacterium sp. TMT1-3]|uniref:transglutaminase-like domain-containing protein n=1 Tax=Cryobacterium sp. TMT1-3 TaxID=1259237 RepID=UPI0010690FFD|nr:transglutaminase-like domain-containing protein [Cryobacterium sp. TMT1-3]TFC31804.1 transglutaminase domain-containing protein [Cryobacterium sp. TMT1-3]
MSAPATPTSDAGRPVTGAMPTIRPRRPRRARSHRRRARVINALFVVAMMLVAVWAAWPIYQDVSYLIMAAGAMLTGIALAWLGARRGWSWFTVLLAVLGGYLLLGVPLAVPTALSSVPNILGGLLDLVTATVFSWKELVTIALPVGSYQSLLAPAFLLFLGGTTVALSLVWRGGRLFALAVPLIFAVQLFGLVFGSSAVSIPLTVLGWSVPAPRESLIGLAALLLAFGFLAWRTHLARSDALDLAARTTGVRRTPGGLGGRVRRGVLAGGVLLLAIGVSLGGLSATWATPARDVLRSSIDPAVDLREYISPLSQYRSYFSAERYDQQLFTVTGAADAAAAGTASRVRLAVLSYYDGEVFRVVNPAAGESDQITAFARVPHSRASTAQRVTTRFDIAGYSGVWMPGAGELSSIRFAGDRAAELSDGFFYNAGTASGIQLNALENGDRYTMVSESQTEATTLAALTRPAGVTIDDALIPASLADWVDAQAVTSDGAGLAELVTRLRERGYLSHALTAPSLDTAPEDSWTADLGDYQFSPSLSGHSVARIDTLFTALLEKQNNTTATENSQLVAAIGDDEQFAVATALLARHLGFESRVVLGFTLDAATTAGAARTVGAASACLQGICSGRNLAAWVEVAAGDDTWVTVEATPQFQNPLSPIDDTTRDPQYNTEVIAESATEQRAPEANPTSGEDQQEQEEVTGPDLAWLFAALKIGGISLAALLAISTPFLVILGAKLKRRRDRYRAADVSARFAGGWDEYVDAAVDRGLADQGSMTRVEIASQYGSVGGTVLAHLADRAVFGPVPPGTGDSDAFWALVTAERAGLAASGTRRDRWRAALSLRSFARLADAGRLFTFRRRISRYVTTTVRSNRRDTSRMGERPHTSGREA